MPSNKYACWQARFNGAPGSTNNLVKDGSGTPSGMGGQCRPQTSHPTTQLDAKVLPEVTQGGASQGNQLTNTKR
ncbi:hypothetical protein HF086_014015 [Spodoptera exigua]|uniref:Uncharacterized protein n=1 Tax=Spodoptera exigua TaxID=7107 RepID=A0A922MLM8_SPOEX|nr:hypothetical protein HF086_014015 [Spodoptera exigua]